MKTTHHHRERDTIVRALRTGRTPRRVRRARWGLPRLRLGFRAGVTPRFA
jgi:hypothetical protein